MTACWDTYICEVEGKAASILVDLDAADASPQAGLSLLVYVNLAVITPDQHGFPLPEEYPALAGLEDDTADAFAALGGRYVGRCVSDGHMDMFFYVPPDSLWREAAETALARHPAYAWQAGSQPDPDWDAYHEFLYPDALTLLLMEKRRACDELAALGDDPAHARAVEHWAEFPSLAAAQAFSDEIRADGYSVHAPQPSEDGGDKAWRVLFTRPAAPKELDEELAALLRRCADNAGSYLGWSCAARSATEGQEENK